MITWLLVIVFLTIFQILALSFNFPETYVYISTVLILIAALGLIYRTDYYLKNKRKQEQK